MKKSDGTVTLESFGSLNAYWLESPYPSMWDCIFVLPPWLEVWWHELGFEAELYLGAVRQGGSIIGIAPLLLRGTEAFFIGGTDVCDYMDFVVIPGREVDFFNILLDERKEDQPAGSEAPEAEFGGVYSSYRYRTRSEI